jgi:hypothetical protein
MLIHCSVFKFKPETSPATAAEIVAQFEALGQKLPYIKSLLVGLNASDITVIRAIAARGGVHHLPPGFDLAVVIGFDSVSDYYRYAEDESHWELVRKYLLPNQEARASVQFNSSQRLG